MSGEIRMLAANGMVSYGFTPEAFNRGLELKPHFIGADCGSTDAGPAYLAAPELLLGNRGLASRDLSIILQAARHHKIPLLLGSAGAAGADPHLELMSFLIKKIAGESNLHFKMAVIHAEIDKSFLKGELNKNKVRNLPDHYLGPLTEADIDESIAIVGQMGNDPFIAALDQGADVVLAGRACDTAIYSAIPVREGYDRGLAVHLAKIIECGAYCAVPGTPGDSIMGILRNDCFIIEPLHPDRVCTPLSVAAHAMYEQSDPLRIYDPDGYIDLSGCRYEQFDRRRVKVWGSKFVAAATPTIKLEGARKVGYRTIAIAGVRDPYLIQNFHELEDNIRSDVERLAGTPDQGGYSLKFRVYGRDAVMNQAGQSREKPAHEIGVILEVVATNREQSGNICAMARSRLLHGHYRGRKATAGNVAFPYSPMDVEYGAVYEFNIYHLLEVEDPMKLFNIEFVEV